MERVTINELLLVQRPRIPRNVSVHSYEHDGLLSPRVHDMRRISAARPEAVVQRGVGAEVKARERTDIERRCFSEVMHWADTHDQI